MHGETVKFSMKEQLGVTEESRLRWSVRIKKI